MATGWPGILVSLKIKYQRISSIHLHILMDLALGGHGGIVLWKDKWQIQEIQTNLKLFKIWGELISSAWLKQVCVKALVVADYSQPSGHAGRQGFVVWAQSCTNVTKFLLDIGWYVCLAPLCHVGLLVRVLQSKGHLCHSFFHVIEMSWKTLFIILGSHRSLKIFLSMLGPQGVSCSEVGAKCCWASGALLDSMRSAGAQCLCWPYVKCTAWQNSSMGH